nr:hypothetical protein [Tanacetum cinerariifolium]
MKKSAGNVNLPTGMKTSLAILAGVPIAQLASSRVIRVEISSGKPNFFQTESGIKLMIVPKSGRALHLSSLKPHGMRNIPGSLSFSSNFLRITAEQFSLRGGGGTLMVYSAISWSVRVSSTRSSTFGLMNGGSRNDIISKFWESIATGGETLIIRMCTIASNTNFLNGFYGSWRGKEFIDEFGNKILPSSRPDWIFDIDALTRTMNYEPIVAGTQSNGFADPKSSHDDGSKPLSDDGRKIDENLSKESEFNTDDGIISSELPFDLNMPALEDVSIFNFSNDDEDDDAMADMNNLDTTIHVSPILSTRIHKDHHLDQVIKDLQSSIETKKLSKILEEHGFVSTI